MVKDAQGSFNMEAVSERESKGLHALRSQGQSYLVSARLSYKISLAIFLLSWWLLLFLYLIPLPIISFAAIALKGSEGIRLQGKLEEIQLTNHKIEMKDSSQEI